VGSLHAYANTYDNFDTYTTGELSSVSSGVWRQTLAGDDWQVDSSIYYSSPNAVTCSGDCNYATTTVNIGSIYSQIFQIYFTNLGYFDSFIGTTTNNSMYGAGVSYFGGGGGGYQFYVNGDSTTNNNYTKTGQTQYRYPPLNEWITIQIAYDIAGQEIQARWISSGTTSPWLTSTITRTSETYNVEGFYMTNGNEYIDDWNYSQYSTSSTYSNQCLSCTRIVEIISPYPEEVYLIRPDISVEYYVNSSDVIDENNVYIEFVYDSVKSLVYAQTENTNYSGGLDSQISFFDESYYFNGSMSSDLSATGTYSAYFHIYERIDPPWWKFWDDSFTKKTLAKQSYRFFMFEETDALEVAALYEAEQQRVLQESSVCIDEFLSYACVREQVNNAVDSIMYAPPLGYVTYLVKDILFATTTATSTFNLVISFSSTSPAYGKTIDLDISSALSGSIAQLDSMPLAGQTGSLFDNIMAYWIWFLRIALGFYILKRVFSMYDFSITTGGNYQRSGDITSNYQGKGSRKIRIKSYD